MRKESSRTVPPLERLARRICTSVNARGVADASAAIAHYKKRTKHATVDEAVELAVEKQWLRREGSTCVLTEAGVELGAQSRSRPKVKRVSPF
jgi:hypothetical protein